MKLLKIKQYKEYYLLLFLFVFGLLIRTIQISSIPVGIHGDEASIGYNAYSLLLTGKDQNGNPFPLSIDQFGDHRPAGYHYLDIIFVKIFGLSELAIRLPSAIFGAFLIPLFYWFLYELFRKKSIALLGAAIVTISPWQIIISRATSEGVIASFFIILGLTLTLKAFREKKIKTYTSLIIVSTVCFAISFLFYHSARFFVPAFLIPYLFFLSLQYKPSKRKLITVSAMFMIVIASLIVLFASARGADRPKDVSIFNIPGGTRELQQQLDEEGTRNPLFSRFYHNKLYFYTRVFSSSYFMHFSGEFLFLSNGYPIRYRIPWSSNMYPVELPFLLIGSAVLLVDGFRKRKYLYFIPISWVLLAAVPAGLTWEDIPNIQRSSLMIYGFAAITSMGIYESFIFVKRRLFRIIIFTLVGLFFLQNFLLFMHNYFYHSRIHEPWHRSAAIKDLVFTLNSVSNDYKKVVVTTDGNNNFIFYLLYPQFDPRKYQEMGSPKEHEGFTFNGLTYTGNPCPIEGDPTINAKGDLGVLFVNNVNCVLPKNAKVIQTITHPDASPAYHFVILEKPDTNTPEVIIEE